MTLVTALSAVPGLAAEKHRSRVDGPAARALAFFENDTASLDPRFLGRLRPAPLSPALRAQVLTSLPADGELSPTRTEGAQLAALEPIFRLHDRSGMIAIKVIDVGHAFVGLYARTVLLLSPARSRRRRGASSGRRGGPVACRARDRPLPCRRQQEGRALRRDLPDSPQLALD